jgi:CheY-like chemotaxis protein
MDSVLAGRRVLVLEDEAMVAWLLQDMLAEFGCVTVGPAVRVGEALAMIDAQAIDAAVLDVNLAGQMSYPVADQLVARGVPFVFATGYSRNRLLADYRGFPILRKPYQPAEMREALVSLFAPIEPSAKAA